VRKIRTAISPRFATSSRRIGTGGLYVAAEAWYTLRAVIRFIVRTVILLIGNAVGLIVASLLFDGFDIDVTGFILSLIVFTVAEALFTPFLTNAMQRGRSSSAAVGGVALISTFLALLVTDLFTDGLNINGIGTWVGSTVVVWLASLLAVFILPFLGLKKYLDDRRG
jgi:uncharacterized membrane protein YvlD (DUF360 family)